MQATAKYLFDEDFSSGEKPTISLVEAERRRADAESLAYRRGFSAGEEKAKGEAAQHAAEALQLIADGLDKLNRALSAIEARLETEAVEVAVAVAGKLAPALIAREPFAEISALATECFQHLVKTPHVVVRVGPSIYDIAKDKLDEIAQARGFEGRLVVMSENGLAAGDCRIEWADGGVKRDEAAILAVIDDAVQRYVAARITQ
ncbi:MAG TPA: FliH/SctL family protein [Pseudolabrys sp.]|nr:FliH/SctL family protein [Pseudolabrys sp.]